MRSNLGQLMAVIDLINQTGYNAAQAVIKSKQAKGDYKLGKKELEYELLEKQEELKLRDRDYALKLEEAARQEKLYKEIAIVVGIGITVVMAIIGGGVLIASRTSKA